MRYFYWAILCVMLLAVEGCKSTKQSVAESATVADRSLAQHFDALATSYSDWEDVNIPVKLGILSPKRVSVSGRATMERGKSVMISLRMLGLEIANVYITNDSVYATDKINKYYVADDINSLRGGFPVSINDVQDMLLGQAFLLEQGRLKKSMKKQVKLSENGKHWMILPKKNYNDVEYAFVVSGDDKVEIFTVCHQGVIPLLCQYSYHVESPAGMIAQDAKFEISAGKSKMSASIMWDTKNAKWNTGKKNEWKAPNGYKQVSGEALIKMLSGAL